MDKISALENESIFIIREAYYQFKKVAMLWSIGKDSTALLWMVRKAFYGKLPFPVLHIDTGYKFKEIYQFRDEYVKKWKLATLIIFIMGFIFAFFTIIFHFLEPFTRF